MPTSFHRKLKATLLTGALIVMTTACNYPGVQPSTEDTFATSAAETVAAELTQSANGSPAATTPASQSPTATSAATNTPLPPTLTPAPTSCTNKASFVKDVTVPDDTFFEGGDTFTKTWRLENSGTCTWSTDYELVFDSGNAMGGPAAVAFETSVPPKGTVDLSVDLKAPAGDGTYRGYWMLRDGDGIRFGIGSNADVAFWVQILVGPTPTPAPSVYKTGKLDIDVTDKVDLDGAAKVSGTDADLLYEQVSATEYFLTPLNGAKINLITSGVPDFNECSDDLSTDKIGLGTFDQGAWICFQTGDDRIGRFELEQISGPTPPTLRIDIRTWKK
ncbi:MAG: NBR1-Ig-like domain-containing protein [Anaerolineales bacterium]